MLLTRDALARALAAVSAITLVALALSILTRTLDGWERSDPLMTVCGLIMAVVLLRLSWLSLSAIRHISAVAAVQPPSGTFVPTAAASATSTRRGSRSNGPRTVWSVRLAGFFLACATSLLGSNAAHAMTTPTVAVSATAQQPSDAPLPTFSAHLPRPAFSALADATSEPDPRSAPRTTEDSTSSGCSPTGPTWQSTALTHCDIVLGRSASGPSGQYVVKRGDSLWTIAANQLPPDASARAIAEELRAWLRANPHLPDPSALRVGDVLQRPTSLR